MHNIHSYEHVIAKSRMWLYSRKQAICTIRIKVLAHTAENRTSYLSCKKLQFIYHILVFYTDQDLEIYNRKEKDQQRWLEESSFP